MKVKNRLTGMDTWSPSIVNAERNNMFNNMKNPKNNSQPTNGHFLMLGLGNNLSAGFDLPITKDKNKFKGIRIKSKAVICMKSGMPMLSANGG